MALPINLLPTNEAAPTTQEPINFGIEEELQTITAQRPQNQTGVVSQNKDWRLKLMLAPGSTYLYNADDPGILSPLTNTDGVIFPYMPSISSTYQAMYSDFMPVHSNYKIYQYSNSSVEAINITAKFTAQDIKEANYLLAVIHFFKSATKMFYGQDSNPIRGTPPPVCYLDGLGSHQFSMLPVVIQSFTYNLPADVDYIPTQFSNNTSPRQPTKGSGNTATARMGDGIAPGGVRQDTKFNYVPKSYVSWVPTKIDLVISCLPLMSRNKVSNEFSLEKYATGELVNGSIKPGGGFW